MKIKLAMVVDSLVVNGGAEKVLEAAHEIFPDAPIYTLVYTPALFKESPLAECEIHTSFIDRLPMAHRNYRNYLPILSYAIEQFDLREFDVLLSFSYAVAHGILARPDQLHISYTHSPIRQAWHQYFQFLEDAHFKTSLGSFIARLILHYIRQWDYAASARVDHYLAASRWVARGIYRAYRREAEILYPPVDVRKIFPSNSKEDYFISIARLERHKKVPLVVQAFSQLGLPLVVIGSGGEEARISREAAANIRILGWQPDRIVRDYLSKAQAYVMAGEEDFSITAVEAQAAGTPVIAFGRGGVCETVIDGKTGLFFSEQNPASLVAAVKDFNNRKTAFRFEDLRKNAERFSKEKFQPELAQIVEREWKKFTS